MNSLNSPVGLRRLIVYDISQWKTIDKSYKIYEKLCNFLGKEAISYENYEYWFNRFHKENYYSPVTSSAPWFLDSAVCILADVVDKKSLESSYRDLCDAFGNYKISKEDHAYCYDAYYSDAHRHALIMAERSEYLNAAVPDTYHAIGLIFSGFPFDVLAEIVDRCDFKSYLNLRNVSHTLRTVVDKRPPPCTDIEIICRYDYIKIKANNAVLVDSGLIELTHSRTCSLDFIEKRVFRELELLLKNPKLRLKSLRFDFQNCPMYFNMNADPRNYKENCWKLLNSLNHKIHVEQCTITAEDETDVVRLLRCLKPGALEKLKFEDWISVDEINQIVKMDQWKQAKHIKVVDSDLSIQHFHHFSTFEVLLETISTSDLVRLCKNISKSTNFESCSIETMHSLDIETIKNAMILRPSDTPNKYYIPNSNLVVQFSINYSENKVSIWKV